MKNLIFLLTTLMSVMTFAQIGKTDVENVSLRGKVKSLKHTAYTAKDFFDSIAKNNIIERENYIYLFNKDGYFTETIIYNTDNSIKHKDIYTFNNKNKYIESKRVDEKGKLIAKYTPIYNEKGQRVEYYHYNIEKILTQKSTFSYDEKGNLINKTTFDAKGEKISEDNLKYDNNNLFIGNNFTSFAYNEKQTNEYIYNDNNRKIKVIASFYTMNDRLLYKIKFDLNENEDIIKGKIFDNKDNLTKMFSNQYIYDKNNNWIKRTTMEGFITTSITEREITYY